MLMDLLLNLKRKLPPSTPNDPNHEGPSNTRHSARPCPLPVPPTPREAMVNLNGLQDEMRRKYMIIHMYMP
jgi:hypothetical protein